MSINQNMVDYLKKEIASGNKQYSQKDIDFYQNKITPQKTAPTVNTITAPKAKIAAITPKTQNIPTPSSTISSISSLAGNKMPSVTNGLQAATQNMGSIASPQRSSVANIATNMKQQAQQPVMPEVLPQAPAIDPTLTQSVQELIQKLTASTQQQTPLPEYKSPVANNIQDLLAQYQNREKFSFDPTNNPTLQANSKIAGDAAYQHAANNNMLFADSTKAKAAEAIAQVYAQQAPQIEQMKYNQYQSEGDDILQQISTLLGVDNNEYGRYRDTVGDSNQAQSTQTSNTANLLQTLLGLQNTQKADARYEDETDYSRNLNAQNMARADEERDYNRNIYQDETDYSRSVYEDETAYNRDLQKAQMELEKQAQEYSNNPNNPENMSKLLELQKLQMEMDNLQKYGGQEAELKLKEIQSRINENAASASASYARANATKNETSTTTKKSLQDYIKMGQTMKDKGFNNQLRDEDGEVIGNQYDRVYENDEMYDWVTGLVASEEITDTEAIKLMGTLGVNIPKKDNAAIRRSILFD